MRPADMIALIGSYIDATRAAWSRRRTERLVAALPQELRKDIGWPDPQRTPCR